MQCFRSISNYLVTRDRWMKECGHKVGFASFTSATLNQAVTILLQSTLKYVYLSISNHFWSCSAVISKFCHN